MEIALKLYLLVGVVVALFALWRHRGLAFVLLRRAPLRTACLALAATVATVVGWPVDLWLLLREQRGQSSKGGDNGDTW